MNKTDRIKLTGGSRTDKAMILQDVPAFPGDLQEEKIRNRTAFVFLLLEFQLRCRCFGNCSL